MQVMFCPTCMRPCSLEKMDQNGECMKCKEKVEWPYYSLAIKGSINEAALACNKRGIKAVSINFLSEHGETIVVSNNTNPNVLNRWFNEKDSVLTLWNPITDKKHVEKAITRGEELAKLFI